MSEMIICNVCPHACRLSPGDIGACGARGYSGEESPDALRAGDCGDELRASGKGGTTPLNYGIAASLALDPIEKKPLKRFFPGSRIVSFGSFGCNLRCPFCQNYEISTRSVRYFDTEEMQNAYISPENLLKTALKYKSKGNIGVAFTYNEPLISYEYVIDTAKLLKQHDMKTVLVTNGCVNGEIADRVLPWVDALNIDLKSFQAEVYEKILKGDLETVKSFIEKAHRTCHVELTSLIVPGMNSEPGEMEKLSSWVASLEGGSKIPLHVTRFFPRYRMEDEQPTDVELIYLLAGIAKEKLEYVYIGNC